MKQNKYIQNLFAEMFQIDPIDFGRRVAVEKEMLQDVDVPPTSLCFDSSGNFLFYPTIIGIKVVNIKTNKVVKLIGKVENTERFLGLALYQPNLKPTKISTSGSSNKAAEGDPTLFCCAYHKSRFYLFSRREPDIGEDETQGRDVFNEKPQESLAVGTANVLPSMVLPRGAILHTTFGDIWIRLYSEEVCFTFPVMFIHKSFQTFFLPNFRFLELLRISQHMPKMDITTASFSIE